MNALLELRKHSQSVWLDYIRRDLVLGGELKRLIEQDGLSGVTSNPTIFEKAIDGGGQYDEALREYFGRSSSAEPRAIYDEIAIEDVRNAADVLRPVFEASGGADGFVSIEPPPQLTTDTQGTIQEARRLHRIVNRPNLMIKVVATKAGRVSGGGAHRRRTEYQYHSDVLPTPLRSGRQRLHSRIETMP